MLPDFVILYLEHIQEIERDAIYDMNVDIYHK